MADYPEILRQCAERLISTADRLVESPNTSASPASTSTLTPTPAGNNPSRSALSRSSPLEEHRRIFGFRPPVGPVRRTSASITSRRRGGAQELLKTAYLHQLVC